MELEKVRERKDFYKLECIRKDGEYQDLVNEQLVGFEEMKRLRAENIELSKKVSEFEIEIEIKSKAIENLTKLNQESGNGEQDTGDREQINALINMWKSQSKNTRDWTKANQLIEELEELIG